MTKGTGRAGRWVLAPTLMLGVLAGTGGLSAGSAVAAGRATANRLAATEPPPPAVPRPFGELTCAPKYGIRFCPGGMQANQDLRVPSFDGVPLDADLALPATGTGPFPLIVLLNGLGGNKLEYETTSNDNNIDDVSLADRGYAVLMYTARGFYGSCGTPASRANTPACAKGWIELSDQRYEIRDTQYLAGELVDEGLVQPDIAVAGVSYGAGQTLELTALKNRMRLPDGRFVPFTSPRLHVPMTVAAGFAIWPWDDLITALLPNGRLKSTGTTLAASDLSPVGVPKLAWTGALYAVTKTGYLAQPHQDPEADLTVWEQELLKDPASVAQSAAAAQALRIIQTYKSAIGIPPAKGGPAPTVIMSGWTDSLFPANEALRYQHQAQADGGHTPLLVILADIGHGWARNAKVDINRGNALAFTFLHDELFTHTRPVSDVVTMAETCAADSVAAPLLTGSSLASLSTGTADLTGPASQVVTATGGLAATDKAINAAGGGKRCHPLPGATGSGVAVWKRTAGSSGLTVLGAPSVTARLQVTGYDAELTAQLWDVAPDGTRTPVVLGEFRPSGDLAGRTTETLQVHFELNPTFYVFGPGHTAELEIEGNDAPFFRPATSAFTVTISRASVSVPTRSAA